MFPTTTQETSLREFLKSQPKVENADLLLPSFFLVAAAAILAFQDPLNWGFQPHLTETLVAVVAGAVVSGLGVWRRSLPVVLVGAAILLATITAGVMSQPSQFGVPPVAIWPLRLLLILLVAGAWAFLMRPPGWLLRALAAFTIASVLVLALWGGPATAARFFGWNYYVPPSLFAPYWLAVNSHGTLYASDADGGMIWVFDKSGNPQGTIRPATAPPVPTPGPGIMPSGFEAEASLVMRAPTPVGTPGGALYDVSNRFTFCGLVTDPQDNLYTVDLSNTGGRSIMRFSADGNITARWPVPTDYEPTRGCLAASDKYIFLTSRFGKIYVYDHSGKSTKEFTVPFQPFGIAEAGSDKLAVMAPNALEQIEISSGNVVTTTLPGSQGQLQIPYQAMFMDKNGDLLATDLGSNKVLRIDAATGKTKATIGEEGYGPGQFKGLGGITMDNAGRLYVADWQHRVIERFTPDGKIDAVWWALRSTKEAQQEGEVE